MFWWLSLLAEIALHIISLDPKPFLETNLLGICDPIYNHTLKI